MERCKELYGNNQGERLDTIEGPYDLYDQEEESDDNDEYYKMKDDSSDDEDGKTDFDLSKAKKNVKKKLNYSHDKLEVNLDDIKSDDD